MILADTRYLAPFALSMLLGIGCTGSDAPADLPAAGGGEAGGEPEVDGEREAGPGGDGSSGNTRWTGDFVVYLDPSLGSGLANPREACAAMRTAGGLQGEPLFPEVRDAPLGGSELDRFCLLQAPPDGATRPRRAPMAVQRGEVLAQLQEVSRGDASAWARVAPEQRQRLVDPTFASVVALDPAPGGSGGSSAAVVDTARELGLMDPANALKAAGDHPARVVVLDTHPTGPLGATRAGDDHGARVAALLQAMTCPGGGACPVALSSARALPLVVGATGAIEVAAADQPGRFGSPATVARAVRGAVMSARDHGAVLNLSLGWNPLVALLGAGSGDLTGAAPPRSADLLNYKVLPAGPKAVLAALIDARCRGHIAVAAAGNRSIGGFPSVGVGEENGRDGALLPARWMDLKQGGGTPRCERFLRDPGAGWPSGAPLLIAVGGLGRGGISFDRGRPKGRGPVVALADNVAVMVRAEADGSPEEVRLDGTSASAAVSSAALGLMWSLKGGSGPAGVPADAAREALVGALPVTALAADLGGGGRAARVDLCELLRGATNSGISCPPPQMSGPAGRPPGAPPMGAAVIGTDCDRSAGDACRDPAAPTPDLLFQVVPQPPVGCPPCDLELVPGTPPLGDLLVLGLGRNRLAGGDATAPIADWRTAWWDGPENQVAGGRLEVWYGDGPLPQKTTYSLARAQLGDGADAGVERVSLKPPSGLTAANLRSATLVLDAKHGPKPASYVIGVTLKQ